MAVGIQGDRDRRVAEEFLDELGMLARLKEYRGAGVPEIVQAYGAGEPSALCALRWRFKAFCAPMVTIRVGLSIMLPRASRVSPHPYPVDLHGALPRVPI